MKVESQNTASSCGKVILSGEHAVVYGGPAVALPLHQKRLELKVIHPPTPAQSSKTQLRFNNKNTPSVLSEVFLKALDMLSIEPHSWAINGHSDIPLSAGLGSSAAFCVSTVRLIAETFQKDFKRENIASLANELEERFHGSPSGLDTSTVAFEKPISFAKGKKTRILDVDFNKSPLTIALIDTGVRSPTLSMVNRAAPYFKKSSNILSEFSEVTASLTDCLQVENRPSFASLINSNHDLLVDIGVSNEATELCRKNVLKLGVPAVKITGAGGGGMLLAYLPESEQNTLFQKLRAEFGNLCFRVRYGDDESKQEISV